MRPVEAAEIFLFTVDCAPGEGNYVQNAEVKFQGSEMCLLPLLFEEDGRFGD
jgi:hypothetical protein